MAQLEHLTTDDLLAGLDDVRKAPADDGRVELIVRRPAVDEREVLDEAVLSPEEGLAGDSWRERGSEPDRQLTLMNARAAALVAVDPERRSLAGDQLYVDIDLGDANLPPGSRLEIGSAVIEITEPPHRGCAKFASRFGRDALRLVNSPEGVELNLRGVNARVVTAGTVKLGDPVRKVA
ncbi:MAG TPA: MOSC domain-containing protein [Acidimicrobiia bacterium]|nr:MOSC domain-containing protein [Acidimicrobiia bacterium]